MLLLRRCLLSLHRARRCLVVSHGGSHDLVRSLAALIDQAEHARHAIPQLR